jgi:hypothetical protein
MGAGNARASGYVGSANAWSNALGSVTGAANQYGAQQAYNARTNGMYGYGGGGTGFGGGNTYSGNSSIMGNQMFPYGGG